MCEPSAVVALGAHGAQAFRSDAVGLAVFRSDAFFVFQFFEDLRGAVAEQPALAGRAFHCGILPELSRSIRIFPALARVWRVLCSKREMFTGCLASQWINDKAPPEGGRPGSRPVRPAAVAELIYPMTTVSGNQHPLKQSYEHIYTRGRSDVKHVKKDNRR